MLDSLNFFYGWSQNRRFKRVCVDEQPSMSTHSTISTHRVSLQKSAYFCKNKRLGLKRRGASRHTHTLAHAVKKRRPDRQICIYAHVKKFHDSTLCECAMVDAKFRGKSWNFVYTMRRGVAWRRDEGDMSATKINELLLIIHYEPCFIGTMTIKTGCICVRNKIASFQLLIFVRVFEPSAQLKSCNKTKK